MNKNPKTLRSDMFRLYAVASAEWLGGLIASGLMVNSAFGDKPLTSLLMLFPMACLWIGGASNFSQADRISKHLKSLGQKQK